MRSVLLLALVGCAHAAPKEDPVVAGELMIGTEGAMGAAELLAALAVEGYVFEYVAAASGTSHLVRVRPAGGGELSEQDTMTLVPQLAARPGVRYVELNHVRQAR